MSGVLADAGGRPVDSHDVVAHRLVGHAGRQDKMRIVGLGALEIVDHQVAPTRLDRSLEAFDSPE